MPEPDAMPQDWEAETFDIIGLGQVTATGTRNNGLLRSTPGDCQLRGRPVDLVAYWTIADDDALVLGVLAAGGGRGMPRPGDRELAELRELVEAALEEWWATEEAKAMIVRNALVGQLSREASAELARLRLAREVLRAALRDPPSVADLERSIQDLAAIEAAIVNLAGGQGG